MRFRIWRTDDSRYAFEPEFTWPPDGAIKAESREHERDEWLIEIRDLGALVRLAKELGHPLIIHPTGESEVEVYNYYRE